jgi:glycosyltransferase involved in cell wall biosynthesis
MKETSTIDRQQVALRGRPIRSRRRVALFAGAYNHVVDGLTLTLNRLVGHLEAQGFDVLVFAPTSEQAALDHQGTLVEVPCFRIPFRRDYFVSLGVVGDARRRLNDFDPDLIHIATPDFLGLTALQYALRRKIPVVASYHTHFISYLEYYHLQVFKSFIWSYLRWSYGKAEHLYVPTPSMVEVLRSHGIKDNMRLWPRGIETGRFKPENRSTEWRRRLGVGDDEVVVLFVSRLVWEKGLDVLAAALHRLHERGVRHRAVVVGSGPAHDDFKALAPADVMMLGHLEGSDLAEAYASSDVFVFPSATETFGNVTLEAMASGLPVVCADAPGSASIVVDQKTGYLCPPGDGPTFAAALEKLILDESLRRGMGHAALEEAGRYDWQLVLSRMISYYDEVLGAAVDPSRRTIRSRRARSAAFG